MRQMPPHSSVYPPYAKELSFFFDRVKPLSQAQKKQIISTIKKRKHNEIKKIIFIVIAVFALIAVIVSALAALSFHGISLLNSINTFANLLGKGGVYGMLIGGVGIFIIDIAMILNLMNSYYKKQVSREEIATLLPSLKKYIKEQEIDLKIGLGQFWLLSGQRFDSIEVTHWFSIQRDSEDEEIKVFCFKDRKELDHHARGLKSSLYKNAASQFNETTPSYPSHYVKRKYPKFFKQTQSLQATYNKTFGLLDKGQYRFISKYDFSDHLIGYEIHLHSQPRICYYKSLKKAEEDMEKLHLKEQSAFSFNEKT
ncbi:MAG: hypothetical protein R3E91_05970 [Chlamydiales bacterium]